MSMWEIEALIEDAVKLIGKSKKDIERQRSIIWNLYDIQGQFDCSFTNFRVMNILLESGYTKTLRPEKHPNFLDNNVYFEELKTKDFEFINVQIGKAWTAGNPVAAYWNKKEGFIYYDFGSPLWQQLEEEVPQKFAFYDLGLEIIQEAHEQKYKNMVYDWTAFLINYGLNYFEQKESIEVLKKKYFTDMKYIFTQYDFSDYTIMHHSLEVMKSPQDWMEEEASQFIQWFNT